MREKTLQEMGRIFIKRHNRIPGLLWDYESYYWMEKWPYCEVKRKRIRVGSEPPKPFDFKRCQDCKFREWSQYDPQKHPYPNFPCRAFISEVAGDGSFLSWYNDRYNMFAFAYALSEYFMEGGI